MEQNVPYQNGNLYQDFIHFNRRGPLQLAFTATAGVLLLALLSFIVSYFWQQPSAEEKGRLLAANYDAKYQMADGVAVRFVEKIDDQAMEIKSWNLYREFARASPDGIQALLSPSGNYWAGIESIRFIQSVKHNGNSYFCKSIIVPIEEYEMPERPQNEYWRYKLSNFEYLGGRKFKFTYQFHHFDTRNYIQVACTFFLFGGMALFFTLCLLVSLVWFATKKIQARMMQTTT